VLEPTCNDRAGRHVQPNLKSAIRLRDDLLKPGSLGGAVGTADSAAATEALQRWTQWANGNNSTRKACQGGSWRNC